MLEYRLDLPGTWVNASGLEVALRRANGAPHDAGFQGARICLPVGCKVMTDAGTRLLSLANQLAASGRQVTLEFSEGMTGVMGYLVRIGFFELLDPRIVVFPIPEAAGGRRGANPEVLELRAISPLGVEPTLPQELAERVEEACSAREDCHQLGNAAYTMFAELTANICHHSGTPINGYAALQVYRGGGSVMVSVSDSGCGILETIRPALVGTGLEGADDLEVLKHMFNRGISRFGGERGCGLRQCAQHAIRYRAKLRVRLPRTSVELEPTGDGYSGQAMGQGGLPLLHGTHIAFEISLDNRANNLV